MPRLPRRLSRRRAQALGAVLALAAGVACQPPPGEPGLVLVLVVDQLRADRLDPTLPGGLGRLARDGRVFLDAALDHAVAETCPGHVAAITGRHPGPAGVPGNQYADDDTGAIAYCVDDPSPDAEVLGAPGMGRSPRALAVSSLGDWLKDARPGARVFAVSGKDRAAIPLGGQRPDGVWWLERQGAQGFTTSAYYRADVPAWVASFNGSGAGGFVASLPGVWEHAADPANGARPDAHPREIDRFSPVTPHPLVDAERAVTLEHLWVSPYLDEITLAFARALVENEGVGMGEQPDLLAVSLSATDLVGHYYGPWSQESRDTLLRLDAELERFLDFLERRVGRGRLLVVLTSDHGVLPLPEWMQEAGVSQCPVSGGRVDARGLVAALESTLDERFGRTAPETGRWILLAGLRLTVNDARAGAEGADPAAVLDAAAELLQAQPVVRRLWTAEEMAEGTGPEPYATLYRNSWHPTRGGDLLVQPHEDCLIASYPAGTTHGTPYPYDRDVPLVFFGPGVEPGRVRGKAATVDVAPTLAARLGVPIPSDRDGRVLPLREPGPEPEPEG